MSSCDDNRTARDMRARGGQDGDELRRVRARLDRTCNCQFDDPASPPVVVCGYHRSQTREAREQAIRDVVAFLRSEPADTRFWNAAFEGAAAAVERWAREAA